jgi:hypothetical protein
MPSPYTTAAERLNAFVNLDRSLAEKLAELSRKQSRDTALAHALEEGRMFSVRQMHGQILKQRELNREIKKEPLTVSW